jgi:nitrite reductase/ring-hydroxylating ferredoxin subunit
MSAAHQSGVLVATVEDFGEAPMRLVRVEDRRVLLVRTGEGVFALDHGCPHEGYGLAQGYVSDGLLTCAWHNWKFRVSDGTCVQGEESVLSHGVEVDSDGRIWVELRARDQAQELLLRTASLQRGIEKHYTGQIARDTVRLLRSHADPGELIRLAVGHGAPRGEWGWGHSIAVAADCLALADEREGDERALPIVTAIAGIAEEAFNEPVQPLPQPQAVGDHGATVAAFRRSVEREELVCAQSIVLGAIESGWEPKKVRSLFIDAVGAHHLSYGHGAIYTQKAFALLDRLGWASAPTVLPHLVTGLVSGTREDLLPYMRPFMRRLSAVDLAGLIDVSTEDVVPQDPTRVALRSAMLDSDDRTAPLDHAVAALTHGMGVDALLDDVVRVASERMLRYDLRGEDDLSDDFNWLDITHALTYASAARWAWNAEPGIATLRLALFTVFLAHYTGRHEWHTTIGARERVALPSPDLAESAASLAHDALLDPGSVFIVHAHAIKTAVAAGDEAIRTGDSTPLEAAARFLRAPHRQRFTAGEVQRALDQRDLG